MAWNTSEKALELFIIQICSTVFVYLSGCLRFWAQSINGRKKMSDAKDEKPHPLDDKLMYMSVLLYISQAILIVRGIVGGGIGQHADNLNEAEVVKGFQTWYFGELLYAALSCSVKTSLVVYLRRVYVVNSPSLKIILNLCLVCIWATSTAFFFASIFQCSPVGYYWGQFRRPTVPERSDKTIVRGKCHKNIVPIAGIVLSIVLAISDWVLALVPIMSLWKGSLPWKTKFGIQALASLGVLAGVVMIVRIPYIKMLEPTKDFLYETVDVAKWTVIEATLGIIAGCLPSIWSLVRFARSRRSSPSLDRADDEKANTTHHNRRTILVETTVDISTRYINNSDDRPRHSWTSDFGLDWQQNRSRPA
ncbi:hypothetical protein FPOAC1_007207 [Fusarium poae]|uniref:hypothetical protein n=1 Tax=Fusarium poae TaxID=36050 RepID=UPI001CE72634|nr:hypothetical protein FPOAC1_007207 [Fusarium poae]KAG8673888.1 hypothetical protein FPOAC1_007207 [Fusarium poae]